MDKKEKQTPAKEEKKAAPILIQMGIFGAILFVIPSQLRSTNAIGWYDVALHFAGNAHC